MCHYLRSYLGRFIQVYSTVALHSQPGKGLALLSTDCRTNWGAGVLLNCVYSVEDMIEPSMMQWNSVYDNCKISCVLWERVKLSRCCCLLWNYFNSENCVNDISKFVIHMSVRELFMYSRDGLNTDWCQVITEIMNMVGIGHHSPMQLQMLWQIVHSLHFLTASGHLSPWRQ